MLDVSMSATELLKFAVENGMIDTALVQEKIEMQKRKEILEKHPYAIWEGKNGKWYTYLPDEEKGRVLKKRNTKEQVEKIVIEYWSVNDTENFTFKNRFSAWMERQRECGISNNTINKYKADYNRFFRGEKIENMSVKDIDSEILETFFAKKIRELEIPYRSAMGIFGYVNGVFEKAVRERAISSNPCQHVDTKVFKRCCTDVHKRPEMNRLISSEEMKRLLNVLQDSITKSPNYIQQYAIFLALYTGMRVGELVAITWDCVSICEGYILVNKSEKYDREKKEYFLDKTKTGKIRYVPLSDQAIDVLKRVKEIQENDGLVTEYVFANKKGRIHAKEISECMRRRSRTAGIGEKSIHSIRRTFNSMMRCDGVSSTVAAAILGHSERVNENNYSYDITKMSYKIQIANQVAGKVS